MLNTLLDPIACYDPYASPDTTHPDNHRAMDVFLSLRLLSVSEAEVLPLARTEQSLTGVCLCQQSCFYLIIRVYTNSEGTPQYIRISKL